MTGTRNGESSWTDEEAAHVGSTERTSLLKSTDDGRHRSEVPANGSPNNENRAVVPDVQEEEQTLLAKEEPFGKLALIMGTTWIGVFLGAIDSTIIATLSAPIASEFRSLSLMSWLATAYLVSNAACQPISGRLTDIFGRGPGLVFSNIFFAMGNLICGLAPNEKVMILGRVVAGIGGGGLMSISTFLGSDLIPLRKRGIVQGIGNICYGSGAMLGGVFGGLINDHTKLGWRLAFLIQVPPVLLSAVAVHFLVKVPPKQSDKSYLARIDFLGVFLTSSFLVLLLLGLNSGGNQVPWTHPLPLTTLPLSIVAFAGFLWWESRARQPIIPVRLLVSRTVLAACCTNLLATMVVLTLIFYVPMYLQVLGESATDAGLRILPSPVGVSISSVLAGYIMKRTGRFVTLGASSIVVISTGIVLLTLMGRDSSVWLSSAAFFFIGGGYGAMLTTTLLACIAAVDHSQQAVVTSATYLARSLGATVGITIGSAVYQNILKARLWDRFGNQPDAAEEIRRIRDDLDELKHLPDGWYDGVINSFMEAFRAVWLTMLGLAIAALTLDMSLAFYGT
ncbi:Major facilitator superfamily domain, general substrate transporter [Metarhizium rileyi]|uniref:Major facilitator superfamily domain, general substrate transporter n=1 Tax=Metarhizium rileyi (strain RCEF 4871) TaxID=1649241 RepID=A0A166XWR6_METRR|nr:Major facilitator superfamily domain, general substrate transporter [Metarhizium rileyi RCEF 4871]